MTSTSSSCPTATLCTAYKVWSLASYHCVLTIADADVREVKTCPGLLMLIRERAHASSLQRLDFRDLSTGHLLSSIDVRMQADAARTEYIELFNDRVMVKEHGQPLVIVDALSGGQQRVDGFDSPDSFLFLYAADRFLTFKGQQVVRWSEQGGVLVEEERFQGVSLVYGGQTSLLYISQQQDVLVSYGTDGECDRGGLAINVSEIETGKRLGKVAGWKVKVPQEEQLLDAHLVEEERQLRETGTAVRGAKKRRRTATASSQRRRSRRVQRRQSSSSSGTEEDGEEHRAGESGGVDDSGMQLFEGVTSGAVSSVGDEEELEWDEAAGAALRGVTALYYNEAMDEVVTGTTDGKLHIWGRG